MIHIVRIDQIKIGQRRREDLGDLAGLAKSIEEDGLLHPIVIDKEGQLVAGERRLTACRDILGWEHIPATNVGPRTEDELRRAERKENTCRKELTTYEDAKEMVGRAKTVGRELTANVAPKSTRGPKPRYGVPKEDVAKALGVSERTLDYHEQHAETAEHFPFMQSPAWKQSHVLEAREHLTALPQDQAQVVAKMMSEPGIPPSAGLKMLSNLRHMPEKRREKVVECYQSTDSRLRTFAKTEAIENPCAPDPRTLRYMAALREQLRPCAAMFPGDPFNNRCLQIVRDVEQLAEDIQSAHQVRLAAMIEEPNSDKSREVA